MTEQRTEIQGLTEQEVRERQRKYGKNILIPEKKQSAVLKFLHVLSEPMFLLLIIASVIYFILGEPRDGAIMLIFVVGVIGIDAFQEWKTDKTLNALKDLSAPHITVIRAGKEQRIASEELVPGDLMLIEEGIKIPADGRVLRQSDLCVDESSLTGESQGVWKTSEEDAGGQSGYWHRNACYAGTLVTQGSGCILVEKTGLNTEYGKIGKNVAAAPENPTPLQKQTRSLVKTCTVIAAVLFAAVCLFTYLNLPDHEFRARLVESILSGVTLSMAMIPEEFPVILTVFLSMGAWRLAKRNSLVRRLPSVETLGAVSVLCVDKTGTITKNQMEMRETWAAGVEEHHLCRVMGMGCETNAYDPMEKAMLAYCESMGLSREELFGGELLTEYPFTHETKMMGHVWKRGETTVVAAKGSPEQIFTLCRISADGQKAAQEKALEMSSKGLRVIAVAEMQVQYGRIPETLQNCTLQLCGLVGLADPPRESVKQDIERCTQAGVRVVMITGDNGFTASSIARQIGMPNAGSIMTGEELDRTSDGELREKVKDISVFSRVIPEHKMRIVKALQANGEIVAMTGDGVNDAPALKHADIGIAMGKRGSEVSREAADLILLDDNFSTIVDTVRNGRRIYDNIRKAVGYVFTIHIPIAFASLLAPFLRISPAALLLLPLHVVLLELVIDPTCSVVLERQPEEPDIMRHRPRNPAEKILSARLLAKSLLQGIAIFAASFGTYYTFLQNDPGNAPLARSMGLAVILFSNILLVHVIGSNSEFALQSFLRLIKDKVMWTVDLGSITGLLLILYSPLNGLLKLAPLPAARLLLAFGISCGAVLWYELVKLALRLHRRAVSHRNSKA